MFSPTSLKLFFYRISPTRTNSILLLCPKAASFSKGAGSFHIHRKTMERVGCTGRSRYSGATKLGTQLEFFWVISDKTWFYAPKHICQVALRVFEAKNWFSSAKVQTGANRPKMVPNGQKTCYIDHLGPFWGIGKSAMFGHFWSQKGLFGPPCAHESFPFKTYSSVTTEEKVVFVRNTH